MTVAIQTFAHEDRLFQLTQDTLLLLDIGPGVALQRYKQRSDLRNSLLFRDERAFQLGCALVELVQQARCESLVQYDSTLTLLRAAISDALALYPDPDARNRPFGATQSLDHFRPKLRAVLLATCAVMDPRHPLLHECSDARPMVVASSQMGTRLLDAMLSEAKGDSRWITVFMGEDALSLYRPNHIRVGPHAIYRVAFAIHHSGSHYVFRTSAGTKIDDHRRGEIDITPTAISTNYVRDASSKYLFLERISA